MTATQEGRELGAPLAAHRIDTAALAKYLDARLPGFGSSCTVQQFRGGQSNPTYLVESQSGSYVLRKKPPGELLPSAHAVDREYRVIAALAGSTVPVPETYLLCRDESIIGQMFYLMAYVPGRVLADPRLPGCAPAERMAMYESMVSALGRLHALDYAAIGLSDFGRPSAYVARQVARWSAQYQASRLDEFPAMDQLIEWLPKLNPDDDQAALVHGDFRPGNVIFAAGDARLIAVLDWELSTIGHPLADLAYFLMPYRLESIGTTAGLRDIELESVGIPAEQHLLESYARSAGLGAVPEIDFYVAFAMFRLAAILAGVLRRGLEGNAADPRAIATGQAFKQVSASGWNILQRLAG
ncbi:MAG: phosphotransferase [Gammaproteobacteria bacterium]|nr:phosphotransferase [Gammaproteobacteria bacterium]MDH5302640.1 phosphotransferase [Gammaproteobacteria bacterium]